MDVSEYTRGLGCVVWCLTLLSKLDEAESWWQGFETSRDPPTTRILTLGPVAAGVADIVSAIY